MRRPQAEPNAQPFPAVLVLLAGLVLGLGGCATAGPSPPPPPPGISVSVSPTNALVPENQTQQFTATVTNDAQNKGVTWSLSCTGTCGTLSSSSANPVTYTAPGGLPGSKVTITATAVADMTKSAQTTIGITQNGGTNIGVSITPNRGGLSVSQTLPFTANITNDAQGLGVTWSATGGTFNSATANPATLTAPPSSGVYTITATSVTDVTKSASVTIGVTDLTGVFTYHNNPARDGTNSKEYALTMATVTTATFGKLFSCGADGAVYAQPLWAANLTIGGAQHNMIFAATEHDSVYAFDADTSPCVTLWHADLLDAAHGATAGETSVPSSQVGSGFGDLVPEIGITGTPVIDSATNTLYVVSKSFSGTSNFFQRLHALDLITGNEKFSGPAHIDSSINVSGTGDGSSGGTLPFDVRHEHQRPALALANGAVYVAWASHEDADPYHGWVISFNAANLSRMNVYNDSPNGYRGGIWMAGGAPAADTSNNLYLITGNGDFDGATDFGDSVLKLSSTLSLADWFTPSIEATLNSTDLDLGSGGAVVLIDLPSAPADHRHLLIGGGKGQGFTGQLYSLNRDNLGQFSATDMGAKQIFAVGGGIFATPAFWENKLYVAGTGTPLQAFTLDPATGQFNPAPTSQSASAYGFPGATPSVSSSGTSNGVVWTIDSHLYCTPQSPGCGPAVLHAYDATNLRTELWNSTQGSGNTAGNAVKFTVPTIANGKVYIGTRGNNTGTATSSVPGEIDVYGLLPN